MLHRPSSVRLGLDFDNTIVLYDDVFLTLGREEGLLPDAFAGDKRAVRNHIRTLPDGEARWTALQAKAYGSGIARATPSPGLMAFLECCRAHRIELAIVSHKTAFAVADPNGVNLRDAARAWIAAHGLSAPDGGGISPDKVFFESTRTEKIARIRALECTHFVDDLDEVFREPDFPADVRAYLYAPSSSPPAAASSAREWHVVRSWMDVADDLFGCAAG